MVAGLIYLWHKQQIGSQAIPLDEILSFVFSLFLRAIHTHIACFGILPLNQTWSHQSTESCCTWPLRADLKENFPSSVLFQIISSSNPEAGRELWVTICAISVNFCVWDDVLYVMVYEKHHELSEMKWLILISLPKPKSYAALSPKISIKCPHNEATDQAKRRWLSHHLLYAEYCLLLHLSSLEYLSIPTMALNRILAPKNSNFWCTCCRPKIPTKTFSWTRCSKQAFLLQQPPNHGKTEFLAHQKIEVYKYQSKKSSLNAYIYRGIPRKVSSMLVQRINALLW